MISKCALAAVSAVACLGLSPLASAQDVSPVAVTHKASALPPTWNRSAAFMEIFVRSYKDSDGDGIGDFKGLTSKLDYLQKLGVTGIWLMPIMPSEDGDHGYAVNDYRAINPDYGTMADFDTFITEAHKRGIGVILDYVINHSGSGNVIFQRAAASKSSPYRDWYVFQDQNPGWYDAKVRGQNGALWNDPWIAADKTVKGGQGVYYGVFSTQMPDWNLKNPRVIAYLSDTMRFWLNKGVDGFRLDAVTMLIEDGPKAYFNNPANPGIVAKLKATLDQYDNRYLICEASEGAPMYTGSCDAFAYGTQGFVVDSARKGALQAGLVAQLMRPDHDQMPLALQSHDAYVGDRLINQFGVNGIDNYKVAAAIAILASAKPFSYYGEEIGMSNGGTYNDPGLRSPMSWSGTVLKQRSGSATQNVAPAAGFSTVKPYRDPAINFASMNVAAETGDSSSLLSWYTALYNVRRDHPVIGYGEMTLQSKPGDSALIFTRSDRQDTAAVLINLSDTPQTLRVMTGAANAAFTQALPGAGTTVTTDTEGAVSVTVAAKSAAVWVRGSQ